MSLGHNDVAGFAPAWVVVEAQILQGANRSRELKYQYVFHALDVSL